MRQTISAAAFVSGIDNATHAVLDSFEGVEFAGEEWSEIAIEVNDILTAVLSQKMEIVE